MVYHDTHCIVSIEVHYCYYSMTRYDGTVQLMVVVVLVDQRCSCEYYYYYHYFQYYYID